MNENGELILTPLADGIDFPKIKPIRLGEYGQELEKLWLEFQKIRRNGIYVADGNLVSPFISKNVILHGLVGRFSRVGKQFSFTPPDPLTVEKICKIGIISSDIEFEGEAPRGYFEEETSGCADFFTFSTMDKQVESIPELLAYLRLRVGIGKEFITGVGDDPESATLMFAFNSAHPELEPLMKHSMIDNKPEDTLWANTFGRKYVDFPMKGSGLHLAVPVGLPANFIEYIIVNEQSPYWKGNRIDELRKSSICDGHKIPLVSAVTGKVI